jgi:hypothetical protein
LKSADARVIVLASSVPVVPHPITLEHVVVQLLVGEATQYVSHDVDVAVSHSVDVFVLIIRTIWIIWIPKVCSGH